MSSVLHEQGRGFREPTPLLPAMMAACEHGKRLVAATTAAAALVGLPFAPVAPSSGRGGACGATGSVRLS